MTQTFFMCVSHKAWAKMQIDKFLSPSHFVDEDYDTYDEPIDTWMLKQMRTRLPESAFSPDIEANGSHFMFLNRSDIYSPFCDNSVVLEININLDNVVYFDDHSYVMVVNTLCNGWKDYYLAFTEKEANEMKNASEVEVEESWLRMFDLTTERDIEYAGEIELRAMTPFITLDMISSVTFI